MAVINDFTHNHLFQLDSEALCSTINLTYLMCISQSVYLS